MTETQETRPPVADNAAEWLNGLFDRLQMNVDITIKESDSNLRINFQGDDAKALVAGDRAALNGIQTILQYAIFPNARPWKKLNLSVGVPKAAPSNPSLEALAARLADKVESLEKSITVFGMNSRERKAVHLALEEIDAVKSDSEGHGAFRRIKIRNN